MSDVTIRLTGPGDEAVVADLIDLMDLHYGDSPRPSDVTRATVAGWLAAGDCRFAVAFVVEAWRSRRVGEQLMRFLAGYCRDHGIGRMDWETETDRAERFYARLGADTLSYKRHMRLNGAALGALADSED